MEFLATLPGPVRAVYEAGPTGYELARLLKGLGVATEVIAPALIPVAAGDRVKTDSRDCRRLARLYRAGELVAVPPQRHDVHARAASVLLLSVALH